ncbi:MAG: SCO family protein [Candidatus Poseidoniaceae archaeon]|nr:SCO family protein [Candidatus Poseidoniaceae archaeon]
MRIKVLLLILILVAPGCLSSKELVEYNGRDLDGSPVLMFTLEESNGEIWNLTDQIGNTVVLSFMFTRCDTTCPVTSENIKWVKNQLTSEELAVISFVSVTVDWKYDTAEKLQNWTEERGYDWPHLTGSESALEEVHYAYGVAPMEVEDDSNDEYDVVHTTPTYIIDKDSNGRVVWSDFDFPVDLFLEDLRKVIEKCPTDC